MAVTLSKLWGLASAWVKRIIWGEKEALEEMARKYDTAGTGAAPGSHAELNCPHSDPACFLLGAPPFPLTGPEIGLALKTYCCKM